MLGGLDPMKDKINQLGARAEPIPLTRRSGVYGHQPVMIPPARRRAPTRRIDREWSPDIGMRLAAELRAAEDRRPSWGWAALVVMAITALVVMAVTL
jgi:hypothetical protein